MMATAAENWPVISGGSTAGRVRRCCCRGSGRSGGGRRERDQ